MIRIIEEPHWIKVIIDGIPVFEGKKITSEDVKDVLEELEHEVSLEYKAQTSEEIEDSRQWMRDGDID